MDKRKMIMAGYILLAFYLVGQFVYVVRVREFYPAFVMPMFRGVYGKNGVYHTRKISLSSHSGKSECSLDMHDFLDDMSESYRYFVMGRIFGPERKGEMQASTKKWLFTRLEEKCGNKPEDFVVTWYNLTIDARKQPYTYTRQVFCEYNVVY